MFRRLLNWKKKPDSDRAVEAELYNAIGVAVIELIGRTDVSALLCVEMEEDSFDTAIRYSNADMPGVKGAFASQELTRALRDLREFLKSQGDDKAWISMEYFVGHGDVDVSLSYEEIDEDIAIWERSPAIVEKYFPGKVFAKD